jgi:non-ribosomal peptide synthetase component E (peptide arylation enzyme)
MHTFFDPLKRALQIAPHAVAFVCGEAQFTYAAFEARCLHPAVLEAAVFGIPDPRWGEAVHAVVVPRAEVTAEEFMAFCRGRMAGYKIPKSITFQREPRGRWASGCGRRHSHATLRNINPATEGDHDGRPAQPHHHGRSH